MKRFTVRFTGAGGLSSTYQVKPSPSASFPASTRVVSLPEIWSWNGCGYNTLKHVLPCFKTATYPTVGQRRVTLKVHRWWSHQILIVPIISTSSGEEMRLCSQVWAHRNSWVTASLWTPTSPGSARDFRAHGAAAFPLISHSQGSLPND